jgi:hypothetical protein
MDAIHYSKYTHSTGTARRIILSAPFTQTNNKTSVSHGLVVFSKKTRRWIVVRKKYTNEFILIIRGQYRLSHLPFLLTSITSSEVALLHRCCAQSEGSTFFRNLYLVDTGSPPDYLSYALIRFSETRLFIQRLIVDYDFSDNTLEWGWPHGPHGRFNYHMHESPFDRAIRDTQDEIGITLPSPIYITDTYVSEQTSTVACSTLETRYYLYIIEDEPTIDPHVNNTEICERKWANTEECQGLVADPTLFARFRDIVAIMC